MCETFESGASNKKDPIKGFKVREGKRIRIGEKPERKETQKIRLLYRTEDQKQNRSDSGKQKREACLNGKGKRAKGRQ